MDSSILEYSETYLLTASFKSFKYFLLAIFLQIKAIKTKPKINKAIKIPIIYHLLISLSKNSIEKLLHSSNSEFKAEQIDKNKSVVSKEP